MFGQHKDSESDVIALGIPRDWAVRIISVLILIIISGLGWSIDRTLASVERHIKENADTLDRVENKQIVVVERLDNFEKKFSDHEKETAVKSRTTSVYHHQEIKSCLSCKTREGFHPPELPKYGK